MLHGRRGFLADVDLPSKVVDIEDAVIIEESPSPTIDEINEVESAPVVAETPVEEVSQSSINNQVLVATKKLSNEKMKKLGLGETTLEILSGYISRTAGPANLMNMSIIPGTVVFPVIKGLHKGKKIHDIFKSLGLYSVAMIAKTNEHWYFHYLMANENKKTIMVKMKDSESKYIKLSEALKYVFADIIG